MIDKTDCVVCDSMKFYYSDKINAKQKLSTCSDLQLYEFVEFFLPVLTLLKNLPHWTLLQESHNVNLLLGSTFRSRFDIADQIGN